MGHKQSKYYLLQTHNNLFIMTRFIILAAVAIGVALAAPQQLTRYNKEQAKDLADTLFAKAEAALAAGGVNVDISAQADKAYAAISPQIGAGSSEIDSQKRAHGNKKVFQVMNRLQKMAEDQIDGDGAGAFYSIFKDLLAAGNKAAQGAMKEAGYKNPKFNTLAREANAKANGLLNFALGKASEALPADE